MAMNLLQLSTAVPRAVLKWTPKPLMGRRANARLLSNRHKTWKKNTNHWMFLVWSNLTHSHWNKLERSVLKYSIQETISLPLKPQYEITRVLTRSTVLHLAQPAIDETYWWGSLAFVPLIPRYRSMICLVDLSLFHFSCLGSWSLHLFFSWKVPLC